MTALATERLTTTQMGAQSARNMGSLPVAASTKIYAGSMVGLNSSGYLVPVSAAQGIKPVGRAEETVDNTSGANAALNCEVRLGTFKFANSSSTDALTQTDVGQLCFAVDDQTVARTSDKGKRMPAGELVQVDSDGVFVDMTIRSRENVTEHLLLAGADLSAKQYFIVKLSTASDVVLAGAGEAAVGILQNAPANGAIAVVRCIGPSRLIAGAPIAQGARFASDANGKAKTASALVQATGAASYGVGHVLEAAAADLDPIQVLITHCGVMPTSFA